MTDYKRIPTPTLTGEPEFTREDAIRAVGVETFTRLDKAADRKRPFFKRVKNFVKGENALGRKVGLVADLAMFFLPSGVRSGREAVQRIITKKDKRMPVLKDKPWYRSKTVWSAVLILITGILQASGVDLAANPAAVETAYQILYTVAGAFGLYGLRAAIAEKSKKIEGDPARP